MVSFDTTYQTNKYSMIFAPFTDVNHHRQSITSRAGFLANEKIDSFTWLFEKFLVSTLIITDQDHVMKVAVKKTFATSFHRLCMWHIMKKVFEKIGASLNDDEEFNQYVLNHVFGDKRHHMSLKKNTGVYHVQVLS